MKKLTSILFILVGLVIIFIIIRENVDFSDSNSTIQSYNFTDNVNTEQNTGQESDQLPESEDITVLIPLFPDEILVTALPVDFNLDNYSDQIIAVKNSESPFIKVVIGLYNPLFAAYERSYELETQIQQVNTFSIDVLDITGTHANSLIINGYSQTNEAILQAWLATSNTSNVNLRLIADFKADGTIFITQNTRSSSYAFSSEDGDSFPIWVYSSDPSSTQGSLDQLQIMYDWDATTQKYEHITQTRILGRNINAQELAKIQDGTEKTFGRFLSNTWLHSTSTLTPPPFLSVDYDTKTITFLNNDTAEIYIWESSILRRNGILIYATNRNLPALLRRIDITLISLDEIRVKATDTLTMVATPNTTWDGNYKKQEIDSASIQEDGSQNQSDSSIVELLQTTSEKIWETDTGEVATFTPSMFTLKKGTSQSSGVFTLFTVYGEQLIQFRNNDSDSNLFNGFYRTQVIAPTETASLQIVFIPVNIGATHVTTSIAQNITLQQILR